MKKLDHYGGKFRFFSSTLTGEVARCESHHPPVPKLTDHVATPMRHRRNFVAKNTVDAMISAAAETAAEDEKFVDGPNGSTQNKMKSGMVEVYTQQKVILNAIVQCENRIASPSFLLAGIKAILSILCSSLTCFFHLINAVG